jgi:hypothetical protein
MCRIEEIELSDEEEILILDHFIDSGAEIDFAMEGFDLDFSL